MSPSAYIGPLGTCHDNVGSLFEHSPKVAFVDLGLLSFTFSQVSQIHPKHLFAVAIVSSKVFETWLLLELDTKVGKMCPSRRHVLCQESKKLCLWLHTSRASVNQYSTRARTKSTYVELLGLRFDSLLCTLLSNFLLAEFIEKFVTFA
jgi:hypothetical protein